MRAGELDRRSRRAAAAAALVAAFRAVPAQLRGRPTGAVVALTPPPDSRFAREVAERAADELSGPVHQHSLRCWQWANAFAEVDGLDVDAEQLWAATMLHDLALGAPDHPDYGCFAALGADHAARLVAAHRGQAQAEVVRAAIAGHFHPAVPAEPVARCLHSAVELDVVGYRLREVDGGLVTATESAHPRAGFGEVFTTAMRTEARLRPHSSAAVLWRAGARVPMALNPLAR